jgi:mono/diheme cytochrome c family protein
MKNILHTVVLLTLLAVSAPEVSANPPPAYEGRRLYVSYCQLCHGTDGKGRYMPAWRGILDQGDVEALVSYIRLLSH